MRSVLKYFRDESSINYNILTHLEVYLKKNLVALSFVFPSYSIIL